MLGIFKIDKRERRNDVRTPEGLRERDFNRFLAEFRAWCLTGEAKKLVAQAAKYSLTST